jgi:dipeptidyl-peptidase 4
VPRAFSSGVGPDGPTVLFLRTDAGDDPVTHLWRHDPVTGVTGKLVDARALGVDEHDLPAEERARRERAREQAGGIVAYAVDDGLTVAAFALGGRLYTVEVASGAVAAQPTAGPAFDPRPSPDGRAVAYHATDGLHVVDLGDGPGRPGTTRPVAVEDGVAWGRAEFVAAEEMGRSRGFWWDADGARIAVARVDESHVPVWTIADPANPWRSPTRHSYPAAGTVNADVTLWVVDARSGARTEVVWDRDRDEYLAHVGWGADPLTLLVQPRDQRTARILTADPTSGQTRVVREWTDPAWVELVPGSPTWFQGRLLTVEDRADLGEGGTRVICADGEPVTPAGLQVRELLAAHAWYDGSSGEVVADRTGIVEFLASPSSDPTRVDAWKLNLDPPHDLTVWSHGEDLEPAVRRVVPGRRRTGTPSQGGVPSVEVVVSLDRPAPSITVVWAPEGDDVEQQPLEVVAETPVVTAQPRLLELGPRRLRAALLLPRDDEGRESLPVLLDPYGGPHAQRVLSAQAAHLTSQWLADQGFAVLVVDGRGSPGRGPTWERAIRGDLASAVLDDQIDALHAAVELEPRLDLGRVAIRGWSFGGYLAALAVLRRPDVFHAAVAGAPVTDWRLYDTHYTERYLGHPDQDPGAYDVSSLIDADGQLTGASAWDPDTPPALLIVHGMADDNVVAAHALRLSAALLADGRPHVFLPLSGVTHMTPQEVVAEQLLVQQVRFLRDALAARSTPRRDADAAGDRRA